MHFSLVKVKYNNKIGSDGFDDAIFPLYFSLKRLGFQVEILINKVNPRSRNIIFGSCVSPARIDKLLPSNSIIFNLEQMIEGSRWANKAYLNHLREFEVWDYSISNLNFFRTRNISATYIPICYTPEMSRIQRGNTFITDLLFYGGLTEHRLHVISSFSKSAVPVYVSNSILGNSRDYLLSKTKAVLNIHNRTPALIETVRLGYLWANKIPIFSERNSNTIVPDHLEEACIYAPCESLAEEVKRVIYDDKKLLLQAEIGFKAFSSKLMSTELQKVLGQKNYSNTLHSKASSFKKVKVFNRMKRLVVRAGSRLTRTLRGLESNSLSRSRRFKLVQMETMPFEEMKSAYHASTSKGEWYIKKDMAP